MGDGKAALDKLARSSIRLIFDLKRRALTTRLSVINLLVAFHRSKTVMGALRVILLGAPVKAAALGSQNSVPRSRLVLKEHKEALSIGIGNLASEKEAGSTNS